MTWAIIPVTRTSPIDWSTTPSISEPMVATSPTSSSCEGVPGPFIEDVRSTVVASPAVTTTGIAMATAVTRTAEPTVAAGL